MKRAEGRDRLGNFLSWGQDKEIIRSGQNGFTNKSPIPPFNKPSLGAH